MRLMFIIVVLSGVVLGIGHPAEDVVPGTFGSAGETYTFAGDVVISGTCTGCVGSGATKWVDSGSDIYFSAGTVGVGANPTTAQLYVESADSDPALDVENNNGGPALVTNGPFQANDRVAIGMDPSSIPGGKIFGVSGGIYSDELNLQDVILYGGSPTARLTMEASDGVMMEMDSGNDLTINSGNIRLIDGEFMSEVGGSVYAIRPQSNGWYMSGSGGLSLEGPLSMETWSISESGSAFYVMESANPKLTVRSSGAVGIGTTNPSYELDVVGDGRFSNTLYADTADVSTVDATTVSASSVSTTGDVIAGDDVRVDDDIYLAGGSSSRIYSSGSDVNIGDDLDVDGDLDVSGTITAGTCCSSSDIRQKTRIMRMDDALNKVLALDGINFYWRNPAAFGDQGYSMQTGFIAQEVEKVLPEFVFTGDDGYKKIKTNGFDALLVEAVKEQQKQISELESEVEMIKAELCRMDPEAGICG